jgi:SAM-dependent methyltransferase
MHGYNEIEADAESAIIRNWIRGRGSCLEVGGGAGRITRAVESRFDRTVMIDLSGDKLQTAKEGLRMSELVLSDAAHLPFRDSLFDCVLLVKVVHLLPDLGQVAGEISRVSRDECQLIASVPNLPVNHVVRQLGRIFPVIAWLFPTFGPAVWPIGDAPLAQPHKVIFGRFVQLKEKRGTGLFDNYLGRSLSRFRLLYLVDVATARLWLIKPEILYRFRIVRD